MKKLRTKELKNFLLEAKKSTWASGGDGGSIKEKDTSSTYVYKSGDWKYHDNFFGGEPYGGREVVFYKNKPVWIMVYYGWVKAGVAEDPIYNILQDALKNMPKDAPFRGPKKLKQGKSRYENSWDGDLTRFSGGEVIYQNDQEVYRAKYMGGLVDQRD